MQAIVRNIEAGNLDAEVALVVCNHASSAGLGWARERELPVAVFERSEYPSREAQNAAMAQAMVRVGVELVAMAGFDRLITGEMFDAFRGRMINVHPSLLPAFSGTLRAQAEAFEHGVKVAGCTVHFVVEETVDGGPIILQSAVPVLEDDTAESLAARILAQEHVIFSRGIQLYAEGRLRVEGRRVRILQPRNKREANSEQQTEE